jgi:hypothetical protein
MNRLNTVKAAAILVICLLTAGPTRSQTIIWSTIDCSRSDIVLDGITKCDESSEHAGPDGRGSFHYQRASFSGAEQRAYVFLQKPRVLITSGGIESPTEATRERLLAQTNSAAAKAGANFSTTLRVTGGYAKTYAMSGGWQCFSFMKDAPPYGPTTGVAYMMVGYDCQKTSQVPTEATIASFLQKLSAKR